MAENTKIPADADKILFAEDFINFMMKVQVQYPEFRVGSYREFVYNAFNEAMQKAITFLESTMTFQHEEILTYMASVDAINRQTYLYFGTELAQKYFPEGFDPQKFLHFCVHIGILASFFYDHGVIEAPNMAFILINDVLREYDMTTGGWDTLNRIAERYVSMEQDAMNLESPRSLASDEEIAENSGDKNAAGTADVKNENDKSNDLTGVKQGDSGAKVEKPQKPLLEKESTDVYEKFSKYNLENVNTSSSSHISQSAYDMSEAKIFNESSSIDELKLQD